jgi:hypothetical protein
VTLTAPSTDFLVLQGRYVVHLEESPWEVRFAETVPEQARVWVWDTVSGSYETFAKGRCRPRALRPYAPEGGRFLALDWEGRAVETWQTGGEDGPTARLEIGARVSEFAACEERLVVKLVSNDARETPPLQVWDMRRGERLAELRVAFERPQWSYLGHGVLATHSDREGAEALELWSLAEGVRLHPLEPPPRLPSRLSSTSTNRFLRLGTHLVRSLTSAQVCPCAARSSRRADRLELRAAPTPPARLGPRDRPLRALPHSPRRRARTGTLLSVPISASVYYLLMMVQVWNLARNTGGEEARVIFVTNQRFVRVWNADLFPIAEFPLPANAAFACFTRRFLVLDRPLAPDRPRALEIYRLT